MKFSFWKSSEDKVVFLFVGSVLWKTWVRYFLTKKKWNIWPLSVSSHSNISFYNPAMFLTYYLVTFVLFDIISLPCFYGDRWKVPLGAPYTFLCATFALKKKKKWPWKVESTIEVLSSWKYKSKIFCKCSWLQFHT